MFLFNFFENSVFVFVYVRVITNEQTCSLLTCMISFIPARGHKKRFYNEFIGASIKIYMTASFHNLSPFNTFLIDSSMDNKVANGATNEKNCCKNISHMVQKNTADDQKQ